jgi:hypothetical protein
MKIHYLLLSALVFHTCVSAQDKPDVSFGKVSAQDFELKASPVIDSNANAVIIADIGSTSFIGTEHRWFAYVYKLYVRIKIISDKARGDATIRVRLYGRDKDKDKLSDLRAATYNEVNGTIVTTKLNDTDIYEDRLSPYVSDTKFTLPAVKAGSIIEYSYTITSNHSNNIPTWFFQHLRYPCLYSEYKVVFPNALRYMTVRYGLDSFVVNEASKVKNNHYEMGYISVVSNDIMRVWAMKDIPAFTNTKFIDCPVDYLDRLDFFLDEAYDGEEVKDVGASWKAVTNELLNEHYFGVAIDKENSTNLFNTAEKITSGDNNLSESARHLYYYVRDNFTAIPDDDIYVGDLYDINKKKKGSVAELNMLLIALLRQKGIQADPVILSTREYGKNPPDYPVLDKMNYVICMTRLGIDTVYLDASRPYLGFGQLSIDCYNGHARIISENGGPVYFSPEKIKDQRNTTVVIANDQKGNLVGSATCSLGVFGSEKLRREIKSSGQNKYEDNLKGTLTTETDIVNFGIDSLYVPEFPSTVHFEFKSPLSGDMLYFNPILMTEYIKNPFSAEKRRYPVVLDYPIDNLYVLSMEIPNGYTVDELPKSARVALNENVGSFEYLIQKDESRIQFRSRIKLNEVVFPAEDYGSLRDFFAFIIKKYNEQIVFKKIK